MKLRLTITTALFLAICIGYSNSAQSQLTQMIRGTVIDALIQKPVEGATIRLTTYNQTVITDNEGSFRFLNVPVGTHQLIISSIGFKETVVDNIMVNSGKELVLTIPMVNSVRTEENIIVRSNRKKNVPLNDMSVVSARAFTVEETQKYAAAVNDPARMAMAFPGVLAADDGGNHIVIRGNSPTGLLWRMEGIDIPNPNHFSNANTSGGGISILSSQLLSNSDFVTGAFASEYGNALSGVFDLKLRKGNNEKRENTIQAGLLGINVATEGPFSKNYKGSYLINYRYSTLSLLQKMGLDLGLGSTNFQDLSYNFYFPTTKLGTFTVFGFGGLSSDKFAADIDSSKWEETIDRYPSEFSSNTFMNGITHSIMIGTKTNLKSALGYSNVSHRYEEEYVEDDYSLTKNINSDNNTNKLSLSTTLNHKFNPRHSLRAGASLNFIRFNYFLQEKENPNAPLEVVIDAKGKTQTIQAFGQWQYRPVDELTFNVGVHSMGLLLNNTFSIEPRASIKWDANKRSSVGLGFGLHSQIQGLGVYFAEQIDATGNVYLPNKDLEFTRSYHFVLAYNYLLSKNLRLKAEVYYQHLFDVPVSTSDTNTISTLNLEGGYVTDALINSGKGKNYGIELSLEKYLSNDFYLTYSNSFYQSKYTASDRVERNTRFNGNYVFNLIAGKEFVSKAGAKSFGVNIKTIYAGGFRTTPIDAERSKQQGYTIFYDEHAYSIQNSPYFRTDLRISMKWNRKNFTSTLSLDIQNLTNRENIYGQWFDSGKGEIVNIYQTGMIPVLNYKIDF